MVVISKFAYIAIATAALAAPSTAPSDSKNLDVKGESAATIPHYVPKRYSHRNRWDPKKFAAMTAHSPFHHAFEDARAHFVNAAQRVDEVVHMAAKDPARAGKTAVTALIAGIDGQIDASLGTIFNLAHYATFGLSDPLAHFILGPFFQSVTDGLEVLIGNAIGGAIDIAMTPVTGGLVKNVNRMMKEAKRYHMDTSQLRNLNSRLQRSIGKRDPEELEDSEENELTVEGDGKHFERGGVSLEARRFKGPLMHVIEDARAHFVNAAQRVDEVVHMAAKDPARAGKTAVTALIAGIDGQIDASLATIFNLAHYATFGLSDPLAHFILGPFFQSVTDGIEVLIGNAIGGAIDIAMTPMTGGLVKNVNRMMKEAKRYHMDTTRLRNLNSRLQQSVRN